MGSEEFSLPLLSTAQRAMLKRSAGKRLAEAGRAMGAFYAVKPPAISPWQEERYFTVLCMACMWEEDGPRTVLPMEECLSRIGQTEGMNHRFMSVMDTDWSDDDGLLNTKLSRLAHQIRSSNETVKPDFAQLYRDLLRWNYDSRDAQKKWARAYFCNAEATTIEANEEEKSHAV